MPELIFSDKKGKIFCHPYLEAAGMEAGLFFRITSNEFVRLPSGSQLFKLPYRKAVGYDPKTKKFVVVNGYSAVAGFISPGFTITYNVSYKEIGKPKALPLFSYGAVASHKGKIYVTAIRVDKDLRHDSRFIDITRVRKNIRKFKTIFARNRLVRHLEKCALVYGCPNAQNFFLSRYEAPLPTSPLCNARCLGCISYRYDKNCRGTQARIRFKPSPEEVSEIALFHIANVNKAVVSFGQGCEGEPLLASDTIEKSIRLIRKVTNKGTINMNTNGSRPEAMRTLFDAGLESIRVSLNSAQEAHYMKYYKPMGYSFKDVVQSIKIAKDKGAFVSINYLTMPGFTDSRDEHIAFKRFIGKYGVDMVQWRNLNFDPLRYFKELNVRIDRAKLIGIREVIASLKESSPHLRIGYFNPAL